MKIFNSFLLFPVFALLIIINIVQSYDNGIEKIIRKKENFKNETEKLVSPPKTEKWSSLYNNYSTDLDDLFKNDQKNDKNPSTPYYSWFNPSGTFTKTDFEDHNEEEKNVLSNKRNPVYLSEDTFTPSNINYNPQNLNNRNFRTTPMHNDNVFNYTYSANDLSVPSTSYDPSNVPLNKTKIENILKKNENNWFQLDEENQKPRTPIVQIYSRQLGAPNEDVDLNIFQSNNDPKLIKFAPVPLGEEYKSETSFNTPLIGLGSAFVSIIQPKEFPTG